jgi:hypothetical protein
MTPEEREAITATMHPSLRRTFVYLPEPAKATKEEFDAAFPIPPERIRRFCRDWRTALRASAESEPA